MRKPWGTKRKKSRFKKTFFEPEKTPQLPTLLKLWSRLVKVRDKHTCQWCGRSGVPLQSHHIFSVRHKATCLDLENGVTVCEGNCHDHLQLHRDENEQFARRRLGDQAYEALDERHSTTVRVSLAWRQHWSDLLKVAALELSS